MSTRSSIIEAPRAADWKKKSAVVLCKRFFSLFSKIGYVVLYFEN
jgi:hypothetical protein